MEDKKMKNYFENGNINRKEFCQDISSRTLSTQEMWRVASDPRTQASYSRLEYDNKVPIKYWDQDYLEKLCLESEDDTVFNPDYLSYLDDVASYVDAKNRVEKQSILSKANEVLGHIVYGISDFIFG